MYDFMKAGEFSLQVEAICPYYPPAHSCGSSADRNAIACDEAVADGAKAGRTHNVLLWPDGLYITGLQDTHVERITHLALNSSRRHTADIVAQLFSADDAVKLVSIHDLTVLSTSPFPVLRWFDELLCGNMAVRTLGTAGDAKIISNASNSYDDDSRASVATATGGDGPSSRSARHNNSVSVGNNAMFFRASSLKGFSDSATTVVLPFGDCFEHLYSKKSVQKLLQLHYRDRTTVHKPT